MVTQRYDDSQPREEVEFHTAPIIHSLLVTPRFLKVDFYLLNSLLWQTWYTCMQLMWGISYFVIKGFERRVAETGQLIVHWRCWFGDLVDGIKDVYERTCSLKVIFYFSCFLFLYSIWFWQTSEPSPASVSFLPTISSLSSSIKPNMSEYVFDRWKAARWAFVRMCFVGIA